MSLTVGTRLGPYEILSPIGAGGMGEVYKARDSRLDRIVAVKVLAQQRASAEERQRFEREARTISQLSHPHICALYDVGREGETDYLVMEYLEGQPLSDRLASGPLPLEQTLRYGVEIANALDNAHRQGIVHRDLKPPNVMLTKEGVKLLDFGLAKAMATARRPSEVSDLQTEQAGDLTREGTILGTLPYMAPEQVEGKEADERTDIFALGATLYEMATGKRAFLGSTRPSLISSILRDEPKPVSRILPMSPPALDRIIGTCLAKEPDHRWQSAADVALQLGWLAKGGADRPPAPARGLSAAPRWLLGLAAAGIVAAAASMALYARHPSSAPAAPIRFAVRAPVGTRFAWIPQHNLFAVSPDGRRLAFVARGADGRDSLWVRSFAESAAVALPGTEGAAAPFWSPDSRFVAFFSDGRLEKINASGGPPMTLCEARGDYPSGSWGSRHSILFAAATQQFISLVADGGGAPGVVLKADASRQERAVRAPSFLPDGLHFLYLAASPSEKRPYVRVASTQDAQTQPLLTNCSRAEYVPGDPNGPARGRSGYVLYAVEGSLLAQPFDSRQSKLVGDPIPTGQQVWPHALIGAGPFSASNNGVLASRGAASPARLAWIDRTGRETGSVAPAAGFESLRLSPDSRRFVVSRASPRTGLKELLIGDLYRGVLTRLDLDADSDHAQPVWSPDGTRIAFGIRSPDDPRILRWLALRGPASPQPVLPPGGIQRAEDWSPDGRFLLYFGARTEGGSGLWVVNLDGEPKPRKILSGTTDPPYAQFSPDGRWIAYCSPESGRSEVYLTSYPEPGERIRVSVSGGSRPRWKRDGREIYFVSADNEMIAAPVRLAAAGEVGQARTLFRIDPAGWRDYDVTPDGERFLTVVTVPVQDADAIAVTANWLSMLPR
jgi:dipeptidyl aminopeptidase/acylaminoacyl peptidase/predicted Ser/Thr protein kinase